MLGTRRENIKYTPWSQEELDKSMELYKQGQFSIIDVELGGECNCNCVYCDSPNRSVTSKLDLNTIESILKENKINWVFICGLGEPLAGNNLKKVMGILEMCSKYNTKCSLFTNGLELNHDIKDYLKKEVLNVLIKLDSFDEGRIKQIYGNEKSSTILSNIREIAAIAKENGSQKNIAASIVPTRINQDEISDIVKFCLENNMFPVLGNLENAGKASAQYSQLQLSDDELKAMNDGISQTFGFNPTVPICPSTIAGIHITHDNRIMVDESGLSCSWFRMTDPKKVEVCKLSSDWTEISRKVLDYRNKQLPNIRKEIATLQFMALTGCGGNMKELLTNYYNLQKTLLR